MVMLEFVMFCLFPARVPANFLRSFVLHQIYYCNGGEIAYFIVPFFIFFSSLVFH